MTESFEWGQSEEPLPPEADIIDQGLGDYNDSAADMSQIYRYTCFVRNDKGVVVGGALSRWWGRAYEIQELWVEEGHRKHGLGRRLMDMVEHHARSKNCPQIYLETFTFQAPQFYSRLGYEVAVEFKGFPDGISKFIMQKNLDSGRQEEEA